MIYINYITAQTMHMMMFTLGSSSLITMRALKHRAWTRREVYQESLHKPFKRVPDSAGVGIFASL